MKAKFLTPILALAVGFAARAQIPNPPSPPGSGNVPHQGPGSQVKPDERAAHVAEAIKHLQVAGLGPIAEHVEQMLKRMQDRPGSGPGQLPPGQMKLNPPPFQRPSGPPQAFGRPSPLKPDGPGSRNGPRPRSNTGGNGDLRKDVERLTREVGELRRMIHNRDGDRDRRPDGPRGSEQRDARPGPQKDQPQSSPQSGENRDRRPQGDRPPGGPRDDDRRDRRPPGDRPDAKPQGDRPQGESRDGERRDRPPQGDQPSRPPVDGPRREHRDNPPEPKRDGAGEVKPAIPPQSDSIE